VMRLDGASLPPCNRQMMWWTWSFLTQPPLPAWQRCPSRARTKTLTFSFEPVPLIFDALDFRVLQPVRIEATSLDDCPGYRQEGSDPSPDPQMLLNLPVDARHQCSILPPVQEAWLPVAQTISATAPVHPAVRNPLGDILPQLNLDTEYLLRWRHHAHACRPETRVDAQREELPVTGGTGCETDGEWHPAGHLGPALAQQKPGPSGRAWHQRIAVLVQHKYHDNVWPLKGSGPPRGEWILFANVAGAFHGHRTARFLAFNDGRQGHGLEEHPQVS